MKRLNLLLLLSVMAGCQQPDSNEREAVRKAFPKGTFGYDVKLVSQNGDIVLLNDKEGKACVLTSPSFQGRVLTSSFNGMQGKSLGYINHERIASNRIHPHVQGYGGEDRFWIGPQGGQFTVFFNPGDPFDFDHWFTPAPFNSEPFELISSTDSSVRYRKKMELSNYVKTPFKLEVNREVNLIGRDKAKDLLDLVSLEDLDYVGFESVNKLTNAGDLAWKKETGLLSIWILGMFPGGSTIMIPYKENTGGQSRRPVYSEYFVEELGMLNENQVKTGNGTIFYNGSGNYMGKIGVGPHHAKQYLASYNEDNQLLTVVQFSFSGKMTDYVNSHWEIQREPYSGDVVNAYNDGPLDRKPGGEPTFYELESSSPARELAPGQSIVHYHRTLHFRGNEQSLNHITRSVFEVSISEIKNRF